MGEGVKIMKDKRKIFFSLSLILLTTVFSGCGCKSSVTKLNMKLEIWGPVDDSDVFTKIIDNYKKLNPAITDIQYKKLPTETYKQDLINALASGQGPDIFLINNAWLPLFYDKTVPAPVEILNEQRFRNNFVDVVVNDFLSYGKIYATPLSVDTLSLFYNKDLLNSVGITEPPKNWDEFFKDVKILTIVNGYGNIEKSGAALGTAFNIHRSTDVLSLMMLQSGTEMTDASRSMATFDKPNSDNVSAGEISLDAYTRFAKIGSDVYCWNKDMHYSTDAFSEGTAAMIFDYSWTIPTILSKSPKLNFAIAPVPQQPGRNPVDYANYWGFAVAKNKKATVAGLNPSQNSITDQTRVNETWKFLTYLTTKADKNLAITSSVGGTSKITDPNFDPAKEYLAKTGRPAARRDLIEMQKTDPTIGVFATQNLFAKSWYEADADAIEAIFADMINQVNIGKTSPYDAIRSAAIRISQLMKH